MPSGSRRRPGTGWLTGTSSWTVIHSKHRRHLQIHKSLPRHFTSDMGLIFSVICQIWVFKKVNGKRIYLFIYFTWKQDECDSKTRFTPQVSRSSSGLLPTFDLFDFLLLTSTFDVKVTHIRYLHLHPLQRCWHLKRPTCVDLIWLPPRQRKQAGAEQQEKTFCNGHRREQNKNSSYGFLNHF